MTPKLLITIGMILFGQRWYSDMGRAVGVDERTVRRWVNGDFPIPAGVWPELRILLRQRASDIRDILAVKVGGQ